MVHKIRKTTRILKVFMTKSGRIIEVEETREANVNIWVPKNGSYKKKISKSFPDFKEALKYAQRLAKR